MLVIEHRHLAAILELISLPALMDGRSDHQEAFQCKPPVLNLNDGKETLFRITGFFGRSQLVIDGFSKKKKQ